MWMEKDSTSALRPRFGFRFSTARPFSNSREKVTFQELLAKFSLDNNETLTRIGALVHYLESGWCACRRGRREWETLLEGGAPSLQQRRGSCSPRSEENVSISCTKPTSTRRAKDPVPRY